MTHVHQAITLIGLFLANAWVVSWFTTRRVMRRVAESGERVRWRELAQEDAAHVALERLADGDVPLSIVVSSEGDRQILEAMIARGMTRVVYRSTSARKSPAQRAREAAVPTAWSRILLDEKEDGTPCPTTEMEPPSPPPPRKPRAPRKARG